MRAYYLLVQMGYGMCVIRDASRAAPFFFCLALCATWSAPTHQAMHMHYTVSDQYIHKHINLSGTQLFVTFLKLSYITQYGGLYIVQCRSNSTPISRIASQNVAM